MKHLKLYEGDEYPEKGLDFDKSLPDVKREIFLNAKKEYFNFLLDALEEAGFKVVDTNMSEIVDDFAGDYINCEYEKIRIRLSLSHSGGSISAKIPSVKEVDGQYSTKIKTLLNKIKKAIARR